MYSCSKLSQSYDSFVPGCIRVTDYDVHVQCLLCRMYPGSELPHSYDATQQVWYIRARASYPALTFTGPHQSEFTGQRVVTIARALNVNNG